MKVIFTWFLNNSEHSSLSVSVCECVSINGSQCLHTSAFCPLPAYSPKYHYKGKGLNLPLFQSLLTGQPSFPSVKTKWDRKWNKCSAVVKNEWILIEATASCQSWRPSDCLLPNVTWTIKLFANNIVTPCTFKDKKGSNRLPWENDGCFFCLYLQLSAIAIVFSYLYVNTVGIFQDLNVDIRLVVAAVWLTVNQTERGP